MEKLDLLTEILNSIPYSSEICKAASKVSIEFNNEFYVVKDRGDYDGTLKLDQDSIEGRFIKTLTNKHVILTEDFMNASDRYEILSNTFLERENMVGRKRKYTQTTLIADKKTKERIERNNIIQE